MAMDVQSNLPNKIMLLIICTLCAACTRAAPDLPPASSKALLKPLSQVEKNKSCSKLKARKQALLKEMKTLETEILSNRTRNQAAGYVAATIFLPALLATKGNEKEKALLDQKQKEIDRIITLKKAKKCP